MENYLSASVDIKKSFPRSKSGEKKKEPAFPNGMWQNIWRNREEEKEPMNSAFKDAFARLNVLCKDDK